ncbi:MAG: YbhB/YbcL family Raf kinase inhibitor-like protein [Sulfurifustis sp.]
MRFIHPLLFPLGSVRCSPAGREHHGGAPHGAQQTQSTKIPQTGSHVFALTSESFENDGIIPDRLAREHGVSPQLSWTDPPDGAERFVIIMDDPDAQSVVGHTFVHWVACLPAGVRSLTEGASAGGWTRKPKTLAGDSTSTPYRGPHPPSGTHRYRIAIYAMSSSFRRPDFRDLTRSRAANDSRTYTRERFESLFGSDILASAQITGTYSAEH